MKLIIQIPCYNEEAALPVTIGGLPRHIEGIGQIEVLVIDDGSTDRTIDVARACGVEHIVRFKSHRGLAAAFSAGLNACLREGADIIVGTDADNSFRGGDIARLIEPILWGRADVVIGVRSVHDANHFSVGKRILQRLGSWVVSRLTNLRVSDATSGFRAYNREAALRLNIISSHSYVLESIIQAAKKGLRLAQIPIATNKPLRESRLITSTPHYLFRSVATLFRIYIMYEPLRVFLTLGAVVFAGGVMAGAAYVHALLSGPGAERDQLLVLAVGLLFLGLQLGLVGLIGDLIAGNRKMVEELLYRVRAAEEKRDSKSRAQSAT